MEGIFRKNASVSNETQLEEMLVVQNYEQIKSVEDPYATAGVIKRIFNKMPDPIVPYEHYQTLVSQIPSMLKMYRRIGAVTTNSTFRPNLAKNPRD
jgi:hypothetical protein